MAIQAVKSEVGSDGELYKRGQILAGEEQKLCGNES